MTQLTTLPNTVLAATGRKEYTRLLGHLDTVSLTFGEVLYEPGEPMRFVYFPRDSLISLLTLVDTYNALEVGLVGYEGMIGTGLALGETKSAVRAVVQGSGSALRMNAAHFSKELQQSTALRREVLSYIQVLLNQISRTAACNRFHPIEKRLARWLLMTRERIGSNQLHLTQEFLSHMLGVRRVAVTRAALALKHENLIDYSRGYIDILNVTGLKAAACSCYEDGKKSP